MDRLAELRSAGPVEIELEEPKQANNEFFTAVSEIQANLATIEQNVRLIEETYGKHVAAVTEQDGQHFRNELDKYIATTTAAARQAKGGLDALDQQVKRFAGPPSEKSLQTNMLNGLKRQFFDHMKSFREIQQKYKSKYKERIARQVKIVHPDIPDDELEELVESNQAEKVFEQGILDQRSREAQVALNYLKDRQDDLQKLEQSIIQLHELFVDVALIVESQGELIDQIEHAVTTAVGYTDEVVKETRTAVVYQNRNRKLKVALAVAGLTGVGVGVLMIVLFFIGQLK